MFIVTTIATVTSLPKENNSMNLKRQSYSTEFCKTCNNEYDKEIDPTFVNLLLLACV